MGEQSKKISRGVRIRAYQSGIESIEIEFSYRGVRCREILSSLNPARTADRKYATNLKAEIESRIERGTFVYTDYFPGSARARLFGLAATRMTVSQAQQELIKDLQLAGLEETTIASYQKSAKRIDALIGTIALSDLQPADIRNMLRTRRVSRKTWNNDLLPLRRALKRAVADSLILVSPLERVDLNELVPKHTKPGPDPFTIEEIEAIVSTAAGYCDRFHNLIEFACFSGLRPEELAGLQWQDVDLKNNQVTISGAAMLSIASTAIKKPKTSAGHRVVDLLDRARDALVRQRSLTFFRGQNVFCRANSLEPFRTYEQLRQRWTTILKRAGVRHRPLNQTRHTYASHQLSSGLNPLYVASQMGHRGTGMLDVYARWVNEWKDKKQKTYGEMK